MRLRILLPKVNPETITVPTSCAYTGCGGRKSRLHQEVAKPLRDTVYDAVSARVELWSGVISIRRAWGLSVQKAGL